MKKWNNKNKEVYIQAIKYAKQYKKRRVKMMTRRQISIVQGSQEVSMNYNLMIFTNKDCSNLNKFD